MKCHADDSSFSTNGDKTIVAILTDEDVGLIVKSAVAKQEGELEALRDEVRQLRLETKRLGAAGGFYLFSPFSLLSFARRVQSAASSLASRRAVAAAAQVLHSPTVPWAALFSLVLAFLAAACLVCIGHAGSSGDAAFPVNKLNGACPAPLATTEGHGSCKCQLFSDKEESPASAQLGPINTALASIEKKLEAVSRESATAKLEAVSRKSVREMVREELRPIVETLAAIETKQDARFSASSQIDNLAIENLATSLVTLFSSVEEKVEVLNGTVNRLEADVREKVEVLTGTVNRLEADVRSADRSEAVVYTRLDALSQDIQTTREEVSRDKQEVMDAIQENDSRRTFQFGWGR